MIDIRIEIDDSKVRAAFTDWENKIPKLHRVMIGRIAERIVGNCKQYWLTGQSLHVRSGLLRTSISYARQGDYAVIVGTNVPYGRIHEHGGDIVAKRTKYLAIPVDPIAQGRKPRTIPGLFFIPSKLGGGVLAMRPMFTSRRRGNTGGAMVIMYVLKHSVWIPQRPYLRPAIDYTLYSGQAEEIGENTVKEFITAEWGRS